MKRLLSCLLIVLLSSVVWANGVRPSANYCPLPDWLKGEYKGWIALLSNYIAEGYSNTHNRPALQGEIVYTSPSNFFAGIWGSNIWLDRVTAATLELYPFVGYEAIGDHFSWKFIVAYDYIPGVAFRRKLNYIFFETDIGYQYEAFTSNLGLAYSPAYSNQVGSYYYPFLLSSIALPCEFELEGKLAYSFAQRNDRLGAPDYASWEIGVRKTLNYFEVGLYYHDSALSGDDCFRFPSPVAGAGNICGPGIYGLIQHNF